MAVKSENKPEAYFGERARFDQARAVLDSNSEEAWEDTKRRPREWELGGKRSKRGEVGKEK